jgi:hypothetical protein
MVVGAHDGADHDTVTSDVCQAPQSAGSGEHDGCGAGGMAAVELGSPSTATIATASARLSRGLTAVPP